MPENTKTFDDTVTLDIGLDGVALEVNAETKEARFVTVEEEDEAMKGPESGELIFVVPASTMSRKKQMQAIKDIKEAVEKQEEKELIKKTDGAFIKKDMVDASPEEIDEMLEDIEETNYFMNFSYYSCPNCGSTDINLVLAGYNYCPHCGQKIKTLSKDSKDTILSKDSKDTINSKSSSIDIEVG